MIYRCRCSKCRARQTLPKDPADYAKPVLCKSCGRPNVVIDKYRHRKEIGRKPVCYCSGYSYPHRNACKPWCVHSTRMPTQQEIEDRYGPQEQHQC